MMTHQQQHHLLDLSSPAPNAAMLASFDHGLLALHDGADVDYHRHHHMPGGGVVLAGAAPWPQQPASLSLYNAGAGAGLPSSSFQLVGHHHQLAAFAAAPPVAAMAAAVQPFQLRGSRYLGPVKELLAEFCSLGEGDLQHAMDGSKRAPKKDDVDVGSSLSSPWANLSLSSMDLLDLERRKTRLLSMVEEVDRRYRRYREQIRAVEVSFEAMVGGGAAQVYTKLALRAMSRHFRCLRDALVAQVCALSKAMGERDTAGGVAAAAAPGATKGDTPRLRVLDQCLRQQRAFQQSGAIDSFPWRPQRGLPERAVAVLRAWLFEHFLHPYPNDVDKHILARQTGLSRSQVSNWFINARVRLWKPMIEDMYKEEIEPEESDAGNKNGSAIAGAAGAGKQQHGDHNMIKTTSSSTTTAATTILGRQKISHRQLRGGNPNSLMIRPPSSSIVASADDVVGSHVRQFLVGQSHLHGGAVSLTLGLQQQQPLMASPAMTMHQQSPLVQLDAAAEAEEEAVVLPYRNLMGSHSQLLHDFAG